MDGNVGTMTLGVVQLVSKGVARGYGVQDEIAKVSGVNEDGDDESHRSRL